MKFMLTKTLLSFAFLTSCAFGGEENAAPQPQCPSDPRAENRPEFLLTYEELTPEAYAVALQQFKKSLPEWIDERDRWLREHHADNASYKILQGELLMAYANFLTIIEGYNLKLEYLAATDDMRAEKENAFCDFILSAARID